MTIINLRMSSVFLKVVGAQRLRAKDIYSVNIGYIAFHFE